MAEKLSQIAYDLFKDYTTDGASPSVVVTNMGYIRKFEHGFIADRFRLLRLLSTQTDAVMSPQETEEYEELVRTCETVHIDGNGGLTGDPYGLC